MSWRDSGFAVDQSGLPFMRVRLASTAYLRLIEGIEVDVAAPARYFGGNPFARIRASCSIAAESSAGVAVASLRKDFGSSSRTP